MQSFREQRNYHGNQQTYPPEAHGLSRMEEYSLRQQAPMFQSSYGGRREGTVSPTTMALGENSNLQSYQGIRKESDDFYYLGNKGCPPGGQTPHRRPPGPVPTYGPPQGISSNSTGFISHYGREGHHSQFTGQQSPAASLSQYSQDFPRSFSPGSDQYTAHVPNQQLRPRYQSHQPLPQSSKHPASIGTSHVQQMQRSASLSSPALYPLPVGQFEQHYQSPAGLTSTSFPLQRFSGTNYEGCSPGGPSSPYESPVSGSSDGAQQGYSSCASQHLKSFDAAKMPQGGGQGQPQQQNPPNTVQYSNSSKLLPQSQTGQYSQSEVPVRSPMQFQQSFSPISNPSPAASAVQSPSCSSTPSPLMTSGENIQCGQGNVPFPSRNRVLPMSQLSPNTRICNFKDFGVEGSQEKCLADPGLCSLSALSNQLENLPNTVQHVLLSDAVAPHTKGSRQTSKKTDICANSETSSQAEEQLKSPMAESLDGSCSSSSGDTGKRVRQLSGQCTSSEADVKGLPSEKPTSPAHEWHNEPIGKIAAQEIDTVTEPVETFQEIPMVGEKPVGVIVSIETVANRSQKIEDPTPVNDVKSTQEPELLQTVNKEIAKNFLNSQNGEPNIAVPVSITTAIISQIEAAKSPVDTGFGSKETPVTSRNPINISQHPNNSDTESVGGQSDQKPRKSEKYPSLLQEVLQGHHQQERRYARNTQVHPAVTGGPDVPLRPNVLMNQASSQPNRSILEKTLATHLEFPHWDKKHILEMKPMNLTDYPTARKLEAEPPNSCHEQSGGPSERRSVICDISPLRQLVREPTSSHVGTCQERPPNCRAGQSVILSSGMLFMDKSNIQRVVAKGKDMESQKVPRKRTVEQCMPYTPKDSTWVNTSQRSMTHDPNQDYSSYKSHISNTKRGTGRTVSRGRSPTQSQELNDWLKMSPGTSRGPKEIHNMNPTMSLSERVSRDALYSAFFQNTDSSTLGYHTNFRSSSYGESNPTFNSPLHYKRQIYQQDEYKEWLGNTSQAMRSALQHCREVQQKSPRQEPFHVCSPGQSENEGLGFSQKSSYQESSNIDYIQQVCIGESTPNSTNVELKQNNQITPPGESPSWHLGRQASPVKKVDSPISRNQKPFGPIRENEEHGPRPGESIELPKLGCNAHRLSGTEEVSHHNPLIMRRRVRSFISPIPSKRQLLEDKGRSASTLQELSHKTPALHVLLPRGKDDDFLSMTEESSISGPEQRCPQAVSLSSPTKSKILPPRKGRGLKLEAIVQKITSPNVRRTAAPSGIESAVEPVTLDDILSLKDKGSEFMQEAERTVDVVPAISSNEEIKIQGLFTKSFVAWTIHDNKQIKKETDDQSMVTKEFPPLIQQTPKHFMEVRGNTPALESKCPLPQDQPSEVSDKEKLVTPKQERTPPKGYFPSGKKKGRPIGSVSKQKKLQQQLQQKQQPGQEQQLQSSITGDLISPLPPPPKTHSVSEQGLDSEPKPKRRLRERSKEAGTRRRVKQAVPIVAPIEPYLLAPLKYASQTIDRTETKAKSFFPYIHMEIKEELGLSCVIFNAEEEEQHWKKFTSVRKGQCTMSPQPTENKAPPMSTFMVQGPAVTESALVGHLVCCFCGKWANYKNLGDLFGPFYTQEYVSTLSKNPPLKKSLVTPIKVKVRHKDAFDVCKTDSDEEEEEPQQAREQRSFSAHPRYKRRNRFGDFASSRHAVPSRMKTINPCDLSLDSNGPSTADKIPDRGFQIPQLPLDRNEFWMHEGCVLWANGVYFVCGRLYGLQEAFDVAREIICADCQEPGATLGCYNKGCTCCYHFPCAMDSECLLSEEDFSVWCPKHKTLPLKISLPSYGMGASTLST